jgi:hypothetical protein
MKVDLLLIINIFFRKHMSIHISKLSLHLKNQYEKLFTNSFK